ncbi:MAG: polysaccharide biosynthesis/export family protein [Cyclobacteriaceae bacterium]|nr:polysaccharide biosynthesis/export family protein [Cyclobacteriaceae bacterium]
MFKIDEEHDLSYLSSDITVIEKNYIIQPNDLLELKVYTNKGERIIDPNNELQIRQNQNQRENDSPEFLVLDDGTVKFPMIGIITIEGMRINEAEDYLEKKYDEYYKDSYVRLKYLNKRVIVLGAPGGQVIQLENENTSVVEIVALAGGIDDNGKAQNLRLIRGDLHEPEVFLINLSTIEGMRTSMMDAMPGDIIYIEPKVKIVTEATRDFLTIFSLIASTLTLYVLITNL